MNSDSRTTYMIVLGVVLIALAAFLLTRQPAVNTAPPPPGQWKKNFEEAANLRDRSLYSEAQALLESTLDQAHSEGRDTPELAEYLIRFGAMVYRQRKYDEVPKYAKEAEALIDSLPPSRKPPVDFIFHNYCNLAGCYFFSRDYKQAEPYITKAFAVEKKAGSKINDTDRHWISDLSKLNADGLRRLGLKPKT